jgi:hypothetical protein
MHRKRLVVIDLAMQLIRTQHLVTFDGMGIHPNPISNLDNVVPLTYFQSELGQQLNRVVD